MIGKSEATAKGKGTSEKLETAPTKFVEADGIQIAYRSFGNESGTPLVFLQHFSGTVDDWDPAVVNGIAKDRPVVVFDNTGVGKSSGKTPDNVPQMAADAAHFISALGLKNVDLLGFSLGGLVAQQLALDHPELVRRIVLAGTAPQGGEEHLLKVLSEAYSQRAASDPRLYLFFTQSEASQAAGRAFLKRTNFRKVDRDPPSGKEVTDPQAKAIITWCAIKDPEHLILKAISQPVLVVNGSNDIMLPTGNSYVMFKHLRDAKLILYPDSGHGALFQYAEDFVYQTTRFLTEITVSSEEGIAVVRRNTEEVQGRGNFEVFEELFAPDFVDHTPQPGGFTPDRDGARNLYRTLRAAFPDFHAEIHWQISDGDRVTTYKTYHGTHKGTFWGLAPTGRKIHFETVDVMRVRNGKITDHWGVANLLSLAQQLGLVPAFETLNR